jgi:hypothetical protein
MRSDRDEVAAFFEIHGGCEEKLRHNEKLKRCLAAFLEGESAVCIVTVKNLFHAVDSARAIYRIREESKCWFFSPDKRV